MSSIKCKDTSIEVILRNELRKRGYGYRKNYSNLPGKPDIVLTKYKIAIFCDSEFFHGKNWSKQKIKLSAGNNPDFWIRKIENNIMRDEKTNLELMNMGWRVLRFWGDEIKHNISLCISEIEAAIIESKNESLQ